MSGRFYHSDDKGSSRSTRDDSRSRPYERERREGSRKHTRSRSRSPRARPERSRSPRPRSPDARSRRPEPDRRRDLSDDHRRRCSSSPEEEIPAPPPPPRITKVAPIKMSLGGASKSTVAPKPTVASVFNSEDDDEPEEMPAEARMRMRNIGRETPTSAGPNSFGKTKQGFCDAKKVFEKNLKEALDTAQRPAVPKFPQTIYKLK
ncbi:PEST proteolytic signal-containing nuclear protein [Plutella xylostella]|uniref:PEST proteolytic signal-containing nuclear protein n=1 Tax=Plutella xylostella TaxID=51655 RepID=UPI0020329394|nr:PEST proteolytic signal-containing nuclear protein [Plutella xylostella]